VNFVAGELMWAHLDKAEMPEFFERAGVHKGDQAIITKEEKV